MKGKDLKIAVKNSGIDVATIVKKTEIPRRTLYNLYKKDDVEKHYLEKLEKIGINWQKYAKSLSGEAETEVLKITVEHLQDKIKWLENENQFLKVMIEKEKGISLGEPSKQKTSES